MGLGHIHVFGGTSDAVQLCLLLQKLNLPYSLSVATAAGEETAAALTGTIKVGRLDSEQMQAFFQAQAIELVIDATHPFAVEVSKNIRQATQTLQIKLIRYERATQIAAVEHLLLIKVATLEEACMAAKHYGEKVFLTTGSKELANYKRLLPEKRLIARVLPTVEVIQSCVDLGLGLADIVAMKGPFSSAMNTAMYQFYQPDVVITKESGAEGGYTDKVLPSLALGIACIVITRPLQTNQCVVTTLEQLETQLLCLAKDNS